MYLNSEEPRHVPEILAIVEYLQGMKFKRRVFGGVDIESVLDHIEQITLRYDTILSNSDEQYNEQARQFAMLEAALAQVEQNNAAMDSHNRELIQWYENANAWLRAQNDQLYQQAVALWAEAEQSRRVYATG